ncbi:BsuPI-related putative proteinase inhibitor [Salicibibacter kimchii]|uniref:Intracellular proteinase inhibitor BsuPI domain-containing protein n=1 Tax=Salicibibacter kimchii TaxID=2099786 RepID=A0A345BXN7_9BACI|nr:BsuPI-related putative proteinase inhibitor [Salicibibacter kimchii]AXF55718.1 hypothetical protein DT065_06555 [Salicibibacter kimchii]
MKFAFVLIVFTVIAACSQGEHSEGGEGEMTEDGLYVQADAHGKNGRIIVEATVGNGGDDPVELQFNTSQRIEVRLFEKGKPEQTVYRSSQEMMYNQVLGTLTLDPGEASTFNEEIPSMYVTDGGSYEGEVHITVDRINDEDAPTKPSGSFAVDM